MKIKEPYHIIINPIAGRGAGALALEPIEEEFQKRGRSYRISQTAYPGHAIELAREAVRQGAGTLVAVGGDGTANEVLNGLVQAKLSGEGDASMGIIPVGSGNDFAFGAGIPTNLSAGLETLFDENPIPMDIGLVVGGDYPQGRYFGNGVGIGFDAVVGFEAAKITRVRGFLAYLIAALRTIFLYYKAPRIQLETKDGVVTLPALMVSIMNGRRMGGGFLMTPTARTNDGLLSLCIAKQVSKMGILRLIPHFLRGSQFSQPSIEGTLTKQVRVVAIEGYLPVHADGETVCTAGHEIRVEVPDLSIPIIRAEEDDRG
jgi:diacylglycerol kinase (ATP)